MDANILHFGDRPASKATPAAYLALVEHAPNMVAQIRQTAPHDCTRLVSQYPTNLSLDSQPAATFVSPKKGQLPKTA